MVDYSEFFQGIQQLINGSNELVNQGIVPQSEGIGQVIGLVGVAVFICVIIYVAMKMASTGKLRIGTRF